MQTSCIWKPSLRGSSDVKKRLAILLFLAALTCGVGRAVAQERPVVVASFSIINDWVQTIGGKDFETFCLVPPRSEAHGFQLSPRHLQDLRRATLIVGLSPDFEPWLAAWGKANQRTDSILWLHAQTSAHEGHDCAAIPHAWTDPAEVRQMVKSLAARLALAGGGPLLQKSYEQYVKEVDAVDQELGRLFRAVAPENRRFISHHANLDQFARRFGLTVAGTIIASGSGESADPSARHFSGLLGIIRKQNIRVIVADAGQNQAFARRLTEDAGLPPPLTLSFEYLEPPGQPGDTWASMMRLNGRRLQQALLGR
jgi:zinc/manganese transport system substrate-binding protein